MIRFPSLPLCAALLCCGLFLGGGTAGGAEAFPIKVRSSVDRSARLFGRGSEAPRPRLYAIAGIMPASSMENDMSTALVIPVDEDALRAELNRVLTAHGFRETTWGKAPDIVLSVLYGRSQIRNPYLEKSMEIDGSAIGFGHSKVIVPSSQSSPLERQSPDYLEKVRNADVEKLFIVVNAWKYSGFNPTEKPRLLWRTIVFVDDPDQNLDLIAGKMLTVAGSYFDRKTDKEEVVVMSTDAEASAVSDAPTATPAIEAKK